MVSIRPLQATFTCAEARLGSLPKTNTLHNCSLVRHRLHGPHAARIHLLETAKRAGG